MNDVDQEMQQSDVSKDGDDNDVLAEDKENLILEGEEAAIQKLGEGGGLEGRERIVRECYGMEEEENGHCLREGESGFEDENGDLKQNLEKDDSREGEINRYSNALESCEESTEHEDDDGLSILVLSSNSDFEVGSLPFKRKKRVVCVHNLNSLLYFKQWFVQ